MLLTAAGSVSHAPDFGGKRDSTYTKDQHAPAMARQRSSQSSLAVLARKARRRGCGCVSRIRDDVLFDAKRRQRRRRRRQGQRSSRSGSDNSERESRASKLERSAWPLADYRGAAEVREPQGIARQLRLCRAENDEENDDMALQQRGECALNLPPGSLTNRDGHVFHGLRIEILLPRSTPLSVRPRVPLLSRCQDGLLLFL